jgi:hypothetical protein
LHRIDPCRTIQQSAAATAVGMDSKMEINIIGFISGSALLTHTPTSHRILPQSDQIWYWSLLNRS